MRTAAKWPRTPGSRHAPAQLRLPLDIRVGKHVPSNRIQTKNR